MSEDLRALVAAELDAPVPDGVRFLAGRLAGGARRPPVAVVFYGSILRTGDLSGILDFYVIVDRLSDWSHGRLAAFGNRLLPPNVEYHETSFEGRTLRAKVAILSLTQFRKLVRPDSLDNSVWARFSQPVATAWARDETAKRAMVDAVCEAVASAVAWAVRLGPAGAKPTDLWRDLYRRTYQSELRVEQTGRSDAILAHAPGRYERMFQAVVRAKGLEAVPRLGGSADRGWHLRLRLAKPINLARLMKAAFTFKGGADYLAWKAGRHTGAEILLTERQRRNPLLAFLAISAEVRRRRRAGG